MPQAFDRRRFVRLAGTTALAAAGMGTLAVVDGLNTSRPTWAVPGALTVSTADRTASPETQRLLGWLTRLRSRSTKRVVSGQQLRGDVESSYAEYVQRLADKTGQHVAMVGVGFNAGWSDRNTPVLIDHWRTGGLVTIEFHPSNPWWAHTGVESAWAQDAMAPKPDLRRLISTAPPSPERDRWIAQREHLADALSGLAEAGVVVLLRMLHESNGSWFWWGQDMVTRRTAVRELYWDTFAHLTYTRGLHNLLWVYSPAASWDGPPMQYYPGDEFVDIVAPTRYDDEMMMLGSRPGEGDHQDYADLLASGKPLAFGECGPNAHTDGSWDTRTIIKQIRGNYREMSYFLCWHGWEGSILELVNSQHTSELLDDDWVITLQDVDWRG